MATVADLIRGAFKTLGVLAGSEAPSAAEQSDALGTLNEMLDSWAGEQLTLFATLRSTYTLTPSLAPHTIGTAGTFNTTRPIRVEMASIVSSGVESPLELLTDEDWQTHNKTSAGTPSAVWVENSYPLMKLHFSPIPNAADALVLYTWQQLGRFTAASDTFDFPPGYARAIRFNLAKELSAEYGVQLSGEAAEIANESKATLKRLNNRPRFLSIDPAISRRGFNLVTGGE